MPLDCDVNNVANQRNSQGQRTGSQSHPQHQPLTREPAVTLPSNEHQPHTKSPAQERNSAKHVPDLQAGEREEMPLLAAPHHLAAAACSSAPEKLQIPRIKRQIRSRRPQIRTRIEQNRGASLLRSSCTCAEVSSVLPWRRAYPHAKVVRLHGPELMPGARAVETPPRLPPFSTRHQIANGYLDL